MEGDKVLRNSYIRRTDSVRTTASNTPDQIVKNLQKVSGVIPITIFSYVSSIGLTEQTMWTVPTLTQARYVNKLTADSCTIVSDDDEDTNATGTGIWTVKVSGITTDYVAISEVAELDGTTPVALQNDYLAINEMNPETAGSTYTAQGNIDVIYNGGDILSRIPATETGQSFNISYQGTFVVPAGLTFKINKFHANSGTNDEIIVNMYAVNPINQIYVVQKTILLGGGQSSPLDGTSITIPEKHLMEITAKSSSANKKTSITVSGDLLVNSIMDDIEEYYL